MLFAASAANAQHYLDSTFYTGADVSFLQQIEDSGGVFKDNGKQMDCLAILKNHGFNYIRLRIWDTPAGWPNGLDQTLLMAKRIKAQGFKFLLDFHYSQSWADPGQQNKPPAWDSLAFPVLEDSIYQYTKDVISALKAQGTLPDMVQLGNEISCGMLWPDGNICGASNSSTPWQNLAGLLTNAKRGLTESLSPGDSVRVMIHIPLTDSAGLEWFFDNLLAEGFTFDVIGLSYYPWWHGSLQNLSSGLALLSARYNKDIVVAETSYPWTLGFNDNTTNIVGDSTQLLAGYPATVAGQQAFYNAEISAIKAVPGSHTIGVFYWEPDWITAPNFGSGGENLTLFDFSGNLLSSVAAFQPSFAMQPASDWNLVSLPLIPAVARAKSVFPQSVSNIFGYAGGYTSAESLDAGYGYWVKFAADTSAVISGAYISSDTIEVRNGWNLVGAPSFASLATRAVGVAPVSINSAFFSYSRTAGYAAADTLTPGKGYWLKVSGTGKLVLTH
jgi:arabinogalactan endo-1,4-beta-galactosidase